MNEPSRTPQIDVYFDGQADELSAFAAEAIDAAVEDWGVGPYEYHGARGIDVALRLTIRTGRLRVDVTDAASIPVRTRGRLEADDAEAEFLLRLDDMQWTCLPDARAGRRLVAEYVVEQDR